MMDSDREQKRHREAQRCQSPYVLKKTRLLHQCVVEAMRSERGLHKAAGEMHRSKCMTGLSISLLGSCEITYEPLESDFFFFFLFEAWRRGEVNSKKFYPCTLLGFKYDCS